MKKFFTLVVAAFAAVSVFAQTSDIGEPGNNIKEGEQVFYNPDTKVITFYKQWDYRPGWWLGWNNDTQSNSGQDFSAYDEFVLEIDNPNQVNVQAVVCYIGRADAENSAGASNSDKVVVAINKEYAKAVSQVLLQCADDISAPVTVTFKKAYFQSTTSADGPSTGISNAFVTPVAKSSKTFNLAGQRVGAFYKGVVVKDGKKFVQ